MQNTLLNLSDSMGHMLQFSSHFFICSTFGFNTSFFLPKEVLSKTFASWLISSFFKMKDDLSEDYYKPDAMDL